MKKILILFVLFNLLNPLYAHKEWVHQHIIWEAYKLLRDQVGYDIPEFQNRMVFNNFNSGSESCPWSSGRIDIAAWREDSEDPLFGFGELFQGWDASSTHFWNADFGEGHKTPIMFSEPAYNAWFKARTYLGGWFTPLEFDMPKILIACTGWDEELQQIIMGRIYKYYNLWGTYSTGGVKYIGYVTLDMTAHYFQNPQYIYWSEHSRKNITMQILGRIAHLLADMSVPAHIHDDIHPCNVIFFHYGDYYEVYMGTGLQGNCDVLQTSFPAQNYTFTTALQQGSIPYEIFTMNLDYEAIKYLFYTSSQLSDHYKSEDDEDFYGNHTINYDNNPYIQRWYNILGPPETSPGDLTPELCNLRANILMNWTIRATAGLFYWFAQLTNLVPCCPLVPNYSKIEYHNVYNPGLYPQVASRYNFIVGPEVSVENNSFLQVFSQEIKILPGFSVKEGAYFDAKGYIFPEDKNVNVVKTYNIFCDSVIRERYEKFINENLLNKISYDEVVKYLNNNDQKDENSLINNSNKISREEQNNHKKDKVDENIKRYNNKTQNDRNEIIDLIKTLKNYPVTWADYPELCNTTLSNYISYKTELKNKKSINNNSSNKLTLQDYINVPKQYFLNQNYPNPFNPTTIIEFGLKEDVNVKITIYDILGKVIKILVNEFQNAGYKSVIWDGKNNEYIDVSSGVYIYKIEAGNFIQTKKMLLLR
jgi:hypothetical protein